MPLTRITVALTGHDSYDHIRIKRPLAWKPMKQALWDAGVAVDVRPMGDLTMQGLAATDCLVLHGVPHPSTMNLLRKLPCRFAIFEDDLMTDVPVWNPNQISEAQKACLAWCLENACAIVATTQPLADELGYPEKTWVQGNLEDFERPPVGAADRMTRAIYVGGNSHAGDLELLNDLRWSGKTVIWSSCLPSSKIAMYRTPIGAMAYRPNDQAWGWVQPTGGYEQYSAWLRNIAPRFGIGLAPLVDCRFNASKSLLKPIEMAKCGWVPVVSDVPPYSGLPDEICVKVTPKGFLSSWTNAVEYEACANADKAASAWEWGRAEWSYQEKWRQWVDTYAYVARKL